LFSKCKTKGLKEKKRINKAKRQKRKGAKKRKMNKVLVRAAA